MKKIMLSSKLISLIFSILIICFAVVSLSHAAWTAPTSAPPNNNASALLSSSTVGQIKQGGLVIHSSSTFDVPAQPYALLVPFGRVGIGTTTPVAPLHVVGVNYQGIRISGGLDARLTLVAADDSNMWNIDNFTGGTLRFLRDDYSGTGFGANGSVKMVITNDGNVGIGTTTPGGKLEVNGGVKLNTTVSNPVCNATSRGTLWFVQSASGTIDKLGVCVRKADTTYSWYRLSLTTF